MSFLLNVTSENLNKLRSLGDEAFFTECRDVLGIELIPEAGNPATPLSRVFHCDTSNAAVMRDLVNDLGGTFSVVGMDVKVREIRYVELLFAVDGGAAFPETIIPQDIINEIGESFSVSVSPRFVGEEGSAWVFALDSLDVEDMSTEFTVNGVTVNISRRAQISFVASNVVSKAGERVSPEALASQVQKNAGGVVLGKFVSESRRGEAYVWTFECSETTRSHLLPITAAFLVKGLKFNVDSSQALPASESEKKEPIRQTQGGELKQEHKQEHKQEQPALVPPAPPSVEQKLAENIRVDLKEMKEQAEIFSYYFLKAKEGYAVSEYAFSALDAYFTHEAARFGCPLMSQLPQTYGIDLASFETGREVDDLFTVAERLGKPLPVTSQSEAQRTTFIQFVSRSDVQEVFRNLENCIKSEGLAFIQVAFEQLRAEWVKLLDDVEEAEKGLYREFQMEKDYCNALNTADLNAAIAAPARDLTRCVFTQSWLLLRQTANSPSIANDDRQFRPVRSMLSTFRLSVEKFTIHFANLRKSFGALVKLVQVVNFTELLRLKSKYLRKADYYLEHYSGFLDRDLIVMLGPTGAG